MTGSKILKLKYVIYSLIGLNVFFGAWFAVNGDIYFHTDIARDFLLLEDMMKNKLFTLIGPRSGGIPGVFHGPLWLYLNLPALMIGKGNPVAVGFFWVLLFMATLFIIYQAGKKLFNQEIALLSTVLFSALSAPAIKQLFNPYGAVMLFPLFFYLLIDYLKNNKVIHLAAGLFIGGLMIQFQIAFALPILLLTLAYLVRHWSKTKKYHHLCAFPILLIPLSTYVLFELRHNFLQIKAIAEFISPVNRKDEFDFLHFLTVRLKGFFVDGFGISAGNLPLNIILVTLPFSYLFYLNLHKKIKFNETYTLFFYFYIGFWCFTLLFKGEIWSYYYWPFLSLTVIIFSSLKKLVDKKMFYALFTLVLSINLFFNLKETVNAGSFIGKDASSWKFNYLQAEKVFKDAKDEFGYYIYTPDQYGYTPRYALNYVQNRHRDIKSYPYAKKRTTYLFIAAPPADRLFLNGDWWKKNQVKLDNKPVKTFRYPNGFEIEKYSLTDKQIKIESDHNLIQSLHFR